MTDSSRPRDQAELTELTRSIEVCAPAHLHERIETMVAARGHLARRAVPALRLRIGAGAAALAAVAALLVLALGGSGTGQGLSLARAAAVTLRPATMAAPAESASDHALLAAGVEGVSFPYWGELGWRAAGSRVDRIAGRAVRTVFYSAAGQWVGYAIVAGAAPSLGRGTVTERSGTAYRLHRLGGAEVITWTRDGHLCVVSGRGVDVATLLALASWDAQPRAS